MIDFIKDWVLNIVTLVIFIIIIEMLVPSGRMKKYAGLVTGFVLIIAIINPFLGLLGGKVNLTDSLSADSAFLDRAELKKNSSLLEEQQMKQIVEVYRKKIIGQLERSAMDTKGVTKAKADVIINEDYNSENFGEIKRAYLEIGVDAQRDGISPAIKVEKVRTGDGAEPADTGWKADPAIVGQLEDRISSLYGVDRGNIVISGMKE
jgi:stage III sporulation protein AF